MDVVNKTSKRMLLITVIYLIFELGFRAYAIDRMGSIDIQPSEIDYLEMVGRIFASVGLSLFFTTLVVSKTDGFRLKLGVFVVLGCILFFVQKLVFDNLHWFVSERVEEQAYATYLGRDAMLAETLLLKDEEPFLPFEWEERKTAKAQTVYGLLPLTFAGDSAVVDAALSSEENIIRQSNYMRWNTLDEDEYESVRDRMGDLKKSIGVPLIDGYKIARELHPGSKKHQELKQQVLDKERELGGPWIVYIGLNDRPWGPTGRTRITVGNILEFARARSDEYQEFVEKLPNLLEKFYGEDVKFEKKIRFDTAETKGTERSMYESPQDVFIHMLGSGEFDQIYKHPLLAKLAKESDNKILKDTEFLKLLLPANKTSHSNDYYDGFYAHQMDEVFIPYFKKKNAESFAELKADPQKAVKAALIPPLVVILSTVAIALNLTSFIMGIWRRVWWVDKHRKKFSFLVLFFLLLSGPQIFSSDPPRYEEFYDKVHRDFGFLDKRIMEVTVRTSELHKALLGNFYDFSIQMFTGFQVLNNLYIDSEKSVESGLIYARYDRQRDELNERLKAEDSMWYGTVEWLQ